MGSNTDSDQYKLEIVLEATRDRIGEAGNVEYGHFSNWSFITDVSSNSGSRYDKHGIEILELGSFHDS